MTTGTATVTGLSSKTRWTIVGAAVGVDRDQPARSPDAVGARVRSCATAVPVDERAVRLHRRLFNLGMMVGQIPAGALMDRRRHAVGLALIFARRGRCSLAAHALGRRRSAAALGLSTLARASSLLRFLMGLSAVRQLHRRHQGAGRAVPGGDAGRAPAASSTPARSSDPSSRRRSSLVLCASQFGVSGDGVHHSVAARAAVAASRGWRSFRTRSG